MGTWIIASILLILAVLAIRNIIKHVRQEAVLDAREAVAADAPVVPTLQITQTIPTNFL